MNLKGLSTLKLEHGEFRRKSRYRRKALRSDRRISGNRHTVVGGSTDLFLIENKTRPLYSRDIYANGI